MTEENYAYRTSPFFLRNQFGGAEKWAMPIIPQFQEKGDDFQGLRLIGFDKTKANDENHLDRMVHFFLYDYRFESVWKNPDAVIDRLKQYCAVLSPDFSMYLEMAPILQMYNTFRNRWCGAYFASKGLRVIPTVSWGDESTFDFCFSGIEKGSAVVVSTYMVSAYNNHSDQKEFFLKGYDELLRRVEPEKIICYHEPFSEMRGNIVFVDYELSSWRHMNDESHALSPYAKYICGAESLPKNAEVILKTGYVADIRWDSFKGMGRAEGGEWRPNPDKPQDERFLGEPGEIKLSHSDGGNGGYDRETKIGEDGKAEMERHHTDHGNPKEHTNPHDHTIDWSNGYPDPGSPINYPNGALTFKNHQEGWLKVKQMMDDHSQLQFASISDFKWCMKCHGEVQFTYNGKAYSITHPHGMIDIGEGYYLRDGVAYNLKSHTRCINERKICHTADEVLEYTIGDMRLRDIIQQVEVVERTI